MLRILHGRKSRLLRGCRDLCSSHKPLSPRSGARWDALSSRLKVPVQEHVMQDVSNNREAVARCPYLQENDMLARAAERESNARTYCRRFPIEVHRASGALLWDRNGDEYIDALAGAGTLNLGHNHPRVIGAMRTFLDSGHPMQLLDLASPVKDDFTTALLEAMPPSFQKADLRVQFCGPAGTDVTEAAMKLSRVATGRSTILAFSGGYHGHTLGALAAMGNLGAKEGQPTLPGGVHFMPFPYSYRCPFGVGGDQGAALAAEYVERLLDDVESGVTMPAAIILEPIQGEGGVVPAPPAFLKRIRAVATKHGIPLIVDEIQSGFGRSGDMFAFEESGIVPDVLCLSKSLGGGQPMGVVVYRADLDTWGPGSHAGTFRGNALGMAAGAAAIRETIEADVPGMAARKGAKLRSLLEALQVRFSDVIGQVRGRGMMLGMELVDSKSSPDALGSFAPYSRLAADVQLRVLRKGLIIERGGRGGATLRFLAPIVITDEQMEKACVILGDALEDALISFSASNRE